MEFPFDQQVQDTFIIVMPILVFMPLVLVILIGLLTPGRKGTMRTTREGKYSDTDIEQVYLRLAIRLTQMGFSVIKTPNLTLLRASRPKRQLSRGMLEMHTHASKPMEVELRLEKTWGRIEVRATMWTPDLVIMDTGEGRHIDQCLDQLLASDTDTAQPEPLPVPNRTMKATTALASGFLLLVASVVQIHPWFTLPRALGLMQGFVMGTLAGVVLGITGWIDTIRRPKEITGKKIALGGVVLSLMAAAIAITIFTQMHGPEFMEWLTSRGKR